MAVLSPSKLLIFTLAISVLAAAGCSQKHAPLDTEVRVNSVAPRQLPLEPVYNRLRWVALPEVHPLTRVGTDRLFGEDRPRLLPVVHYTVSREPLCEAALILASTARYTSYCSSLVSDKVVSLDQLGTIDELALALSNRSGANIIVDHVNREVRVLSEVFEDNDPRFFNEGNIRNEY